MSKLRRKLEHLNPGIITEKNSDSVSAPLTNREKLERLVNSKLKNKSIIKEPSSEPTHAVPEEPFTVYNYFYHKTEVFGAVQLQSWYKTSSVTPSIIGNTPELSSISPGEYLFFDTETTGLSGGTGTLPFMYGFGWLEDEGFSVAIYMLNDPSEEELFLTEIENFLKQHKFKALVTYNGKSFDLPLTETRLLLHRKRSVLTDLEHLDLLYPARTIWKNTYESRKLGYLGDILLGISREDDVDGSMIPSIYNSYIRTGNFNLIKDVIEHNALDLVGLNALMLLVTIYVESEGEDTAHHGERLGVAIILEQAGHIDAAEKVYRKLIDFFPEDEITRIAVRRLADLKKRQKLFPEAKELWSSLAGEIDKTSVRELAIHYEHREKNPHKALYIIESVIDTLELTPKQMEDMQKRMLRLKNKISNNSASSDSTKS